jgi:hypothetical protein
MIKNNNDKRYHTAIPNSRKNTNRKVEEVEKGRKFSYSFFNLFDFAVKFLPIFSSFGITAADPLYCCKQQNNLD